MLETIRFYLREFVQEDWKAVHTYASQEIVSQYQPWGPNSPQETKRYITDVLQQQLEQPRTGFTFAIVWKGTDRVIGAGELSAIDSTNRSGEIGYILHPDYWGQGIASDLALVLLKFGFEERRLHRIEARCDPQNMGSQRVLEKAGMVKEGRLRQNLRMNNGWRDSLLYGILEDEWKW
ncbi:RimJ/RimL family protein N-acetyltransferase [Planomicrobium stackebrandtii]|uniref:RimJ/RimL family protein N-acetyltransferase n=1 Tax=Planomicrobium stackebrandtii TaxID=253160 RepID=A0ABU0GXN1_9BACL|nr:GNAT family protein [Planomicrobium stackebrandtii]MDQ0429310.1 RimJ/RimL family protein N-acetyltransferase [Planomicrobium stackebrandtii]